MATTRNWALVCLFLVLLFCGFSSVSAATAPAKIVSSVVSNVVSALFKWLWSLKSTPKTPVSSRSMMKFEGGYAVETVFDGSKMGIEPYSVMESAGGELLVLDSENSNLYKISSSLSRYSRPKLIAGSSEGYTGHVDGRPRESRMDHPKGLTVDDRGNMYIADTANMAIRKISDAGVTTIAGGNRGRGGGHVDGPSEDARFSGDFDLVYIGSSCSLLVIDRGHQAIREIQLHEEDCARESDTSFHLGIAVLVAAAFFGYMLALLQRRVQAMFSSNHDPRSSIKRVTPTDPYQIPPKYARPPLIPNEDEPEKQESSFFGPLGRLFSRSTPKKPLLHNYPIQQQYQYQQQQNIGPNTWPMQESFVIPREDGPPPIEARTPAAKRGRYPLVAAREVEKTRHFRQSQAYYEQWGGGGNDHDHHQYRQIEQQQRQQQHRSEGAETFYEESCETNEVVFGAVQEGDGRREAMVIKAVDYGNPMFDHHNLRPRVNYLGYSEQSHAY